MVNLAFSPLLERSNAASGSAGQAEAAAHHAARAAAVQCTSILTHQVLDYKRRQLFELYACVQALRDVFESAMNTGLTQVDGSEGAFARLAAPLRGVDGFMAAAGWHPRRGPGGGLWVLPGGAAGGALSLEQQSMLKAALDSLDRAGQLLERKSRETGQSLDPPPDPAAALAAAAEARSRREERRRQLQERRRHEAAGQEGQPVDGGLSWEQQLAAAQAAQRLAEFQQLHETAEEYERRQAGFESELAKSIAERERRQQEERLAALRAARALKEEQDRDYEQALEKDRRKQGKKAGSGGSGADAAAAAAGTAAAAATAAAGAPPLSEGGQLGSGGRGPAGVRQGGRVLGRRGDSPPEDARHSAAGTESGGKGSADVDGAGGQLDQLLSQLPPEPSQGDPAAVTIRLRLPDGSARSRRFSARDSVADARHWMRCCCMQLGAAAAPGAGAAASYRQGHAAPAGVAPAAGGAWALAAGPFSGAVDNALLQQPHALLADVAGSGRQLALFAAPAAQE